MGVPSTPRRGVEVHAKAVEQLAEARDRQRDLVAAADAAEGTAGEDEAVDALGMARSQVAVREAWAVWTERGVW